MNEQTPRAERLHIAFYGRRNSGKSSLINALTGQQSAVVSATPGTTTDPVLKTMEIHGLGPCVLIDTPGFDDEGDLGALRVQQSRKMLDKTDLAVLLLSGAVPQNDEIEWFRLLEARHIPIVVVRSKADLFTGMSDAEAEALFGQRPLRVSASDRTGLDALREALIRNLPEDYNQPEITGSLASTGDVVMLVMPQDIQAPKGRLILPQVQTIRELLDKKCRVVCCTTDQIEGTLSSLAAPPKLIITDSQVFSTVYAQKPAASLLTSFSVLFARYKGDIDYFVESAAAIGQLREDSRVLIAEACTHAPVGEDIGRVKIPAMLRKRIGPALRVDVVAGTDFPADLTPYDLVIHCGACMFNRRHVLSRVAQARAQHVPMTNYGVRSLTCKGFSTRSNINPKNTYPKEWAVRQLDGPLFIKNRNYSGKYYFASDGKYFIYCTRWNMAEVSFLKFRRPRNSSSEPKPCRSDQRSMYSFISAMTSNPFWWIAVQTCTASAPHKSALTAASPSCTPVETERSNCGNTAEQIATIRRTLRNSVGSL